MPGSNLPDRSIETEQLTARKAMVLHDDVIDLLGKRSLCKIVGRAACAQRYPVIVGDQCREFVKVDSGNLRGGGSASTCIAAVVDVEKLEHSLSSGPYQDQFGNLIIRPYDLYSHRLRILRPLRGARDSAEGELCQLPADSRLLKASLVFPNGAHVAMVIGTRDCATHLLSIVPRPVLDEHPG